jgi:hypothetical protein
MRQPYSALGWVAGACGFRPVPGECPEWQRGRTVNPLAYAFVGSSPTSPTNLILLGNLTITRPFFALPCRVVLQNISLYFQWPRWLPATPRDLNATYAAGFLRAAEIGSHKAALLAGFGNSSTAGSSSWSPAAALAPRAEARRRIGGLLKRIISAGRRRAISCSGTGGHFSKSKNRIPSPKPGTVVSPKPGTVRPHAVPETGDITSSPSPKLPKNGGAAPKGRETG